MKGFSVLEVILAATIFVIFATSGVVIVISGFNANRLGLETTVANQFNTEGMEAVRSIKNQSYATLAAMGDAGNTGVAINAGVWTFSGTSNTLPSDNRYNRVISVSCIQRDNNGNITGSVACTNIARDDNTRKVTVTTSWNFNSSRSDSVILTEYLSNWKGQKGGFLTYGNGGVSTDIVSRQQFNAFPTPTLNAFAAPVSFDIDPSHTNRVLEVQRSYSSSTRNEKMILSRHFDGTNQYIYGSVWNGTTWTATQLSSWVQANNDFLNFDGGYLANGDFIAIYSNNTNRPQYSTFNGTSWTNRGNVGSTALSNSPNWITAGVRPSTSEIMTSFLTSDGSTQSYFGNCASYPCTWSSLTTNGSATTDVNRKVIDFAFSANSPVTGVLIFANSSTDKNLTGQLFQANGSGGGTWQSVVNSQTKQSNNIGSLSIVQRPKNNEFEACDKDIPPSGSPNIICYNLTFSGTSLSISKPTSSLATTDTGIQRSFDLGYENVSGGVAILVYADSTALTIPKYKLYNASTQTWSGATAITMPGSPGQFKTVRVESQDQGDDMIVMAGDSNLDFYTVFFNGSTNTLYANPASMAPLIHGTNGSAANQFWFDYTWDKF